MSDACIYLYTTSNPCIIPVQLLFKSKATLIFFILSPYKPVILIAFDGNRYSGVSVHTISISYPASDSLCSSTQLSIAFIHIVMVFSSSEIKYLFRLPKCSIKPCALSPRFSKCSSICSLYTLFSGIYTPVPSIKTFFICTFSY